MSNARKDAYPTAIYIMAGLLAIGFICNLLARPVAESHYFKSDAAPPAMNAPPEPETARVEHGATA